MNAPRPAHWEWARQLLAHEGAGGGNAEACAEAAGTIYDKLCERLAPLLGAAGVYALLGRSARLTRVDFQLMDAAAVESSQGLRERLRVQDSTLAAETATALFATFFALISRFIGERLTTEALRSAWPMLEATVTKDTPR